MPPKTWHVWAYCVNFLGIARASGITADIAETKRCNELSQTLTIEFRGWLAGLHILLLDTSLKLGKQPANDSHSQTKEESN